MHTERENRKQLPYCHTLKELFSNFGFTLLCFAKTNRKLSKPNTKKNLPNPTKQNKNKEEPASTIES